MMNACSGGIVYLLLACMALGSIIHESMGCESTQKNTNYITNCNNEQLSMIPASVSDLTTHLIFYSNTLSNLTYSDMLSRFFNLKVLNISHNYINEESFKADIFADMRTLDTVDLQRNRITVLPSQFIRNAQIRSLRLDYNKIRHVAEDFLVNLLKLEELTLSHCEIQSISGKAFRSIDSDLMRLDLSHNQLQTLSVDVRPDIFTSSLQSVKLHDNFWNCDCHLRWLREELEKTDAMWYFLGYSVIPECEEPLYLKHKNWFLARADLYGCVPVISTSQPDILAQIGDEVTITCSILAESEPSSVQWLQNDVTIEYMDNLKTTQSYEMSSTQLLSNLTVSQLSQHDYGVYKCTVNTTFGSVTQVTNVSSPPAAITQTNNTGVIIAVVVVVVVIVIAIALVVGIYLKKNLVYRGKLYMDALSEMSHKSETDVSMQTRGEDMTVITPLNMSEDTALTIDTDRSLPVDELDSLPADTEYPADDAGCAEYNQYLQTVSSANHSPAIIEAANPSVAYVEPTHQIHIPPPLPSQSYSPQHSQPMYIPSSNGGPTYIRTVSPSHHTSRGASVKPSSDRDNTLPYLDMSGYNRAASPARSNSSSGAGDMISNRIESNTPGSSPLTFIKEEPGEDTAKDLL